MNINMNLIFYISILFTCNFFKTVLCVPGKFPVNIQFDWINNKGYYFETFFATNWFRANEFCVSHGMQLATVETEQERNFINSRIIEMGEPQQFKKTFWLGGSNLSIEIFFTWHTTGRIINSELWGPSEPNLSKQQGCVKISWSANYEKFYLNDELCSFNTYFICQITK